MPALIAIPWLVPLITGIAAAGTLATTGYELANQPSSSGSSATGTAATQAQAQAQAQAQLTAQQKAAFVAAQPNVQASTGGGLTGTAFNTAAATQAGVPSDLNSIAKYLGMGTTGSSPANANVSGGVTVTPGATNSQQSPYDLQSLSDLLKG
jgi:hypothetical protein